MYYVLLALADAEPYRIEYASRFAAIFAFDQAGFDLVGSDIIHGWVC